MKLFSYHKCLLLQCRGTCNKFSECSIHALPSTMFVEKCGGGGSLGTTTCLTIVVGGKQGHAPYKLALLQQGLFFCPSNVMEIIRLLQRFGNFGQPQFLGYCWI